MEEKRHWDDVGYFETMTMDILKGPEYGFYVAKPGI